MTRAVTPKPAIWMDAGIHSNEWLAPSTMLYFIAKVRFNSLRYKYHFWCFYVLRNGHAMIKQSYHLACSSCWMAQTLSSMRFWITLCSTSCQCSTSTATIIRGRRCPETFETTYPCSVTTDQILRHRSACNWAAFKSNSGVDLQDRFWRKSRSRRNPDSACIGVDLNRNWDVAWNGK